MKNDYDVLVIGAGAAGLMAALEVALTGKKVAIIEARERAGGRILTVHNNQFPMPVEAGAEFVHGELELSLSLLKEAGISYHKIEGSMWQSTGNELTEQDDFIEDYAAVSKKLNELKQDIPIREFINQYLQEEKFEDARFTLEHYAEGYYAADTNKASTFAMRDDLSHSSEVQYSIEGGYMQLVDHLCGKAKAAGVTLIFSQPVAEVQWSIGAVTVKSDTNSYHAKKILITVPTGVLQSRSIRFSPALPAQMAAADRLGFGSVIKLVLEFDNAFWKSAGGKDLSDVLFIFSDQPIPTWWTQYPSQAPILTGWLGGTKTEEMRGYNSDELMETAIASLSSIFNIDRLRLQQMLKGYLAVNWKADPFSCGAYSYEVVNGADAKKILASGVAETIFFAGEGLHQGPEIGTVEAALINGREMAYKLIASF